MEHEQRTLDIPNKEDRLTVARILIDNGYTVQQRRRKVGNKTVSYLEYWDTAQKSV